MFAHPRIIGEVEAEARCRATGRAQLQLVITVPPTAFDVQLIGGLIIGAGICTAAGCCTTIGVEANAASAAARRDASASADAWCI